MVEFIYENMALILICAVPTLSLLLNIISIIGWIPNFICSIVFRKNIKKARVPIILSIFFGIIFIITLLILLATIIFIVSLTLMFMVAVQHM